LFFKYREFEIIYRKKRDYVTEKEGDFFAAEKSFSISNHDGGDAEIVADCIGLSVSACERFGYI